MIRMEYTPGKITKTTRILFPIVVTVIAGIVSPQSVALVGFLMFGNLLRECGVLRQPVRDGAERAGEPHHACCWGMTVAVQHAGGEFPACRKR